MSLSTDCIRHTITPPPIRCLHMLAMIMNIAITVRVITYYDLYDVWWFICVFPTYGTGVWPSKGVLIKSHNLLFIYLCYTHSCKWRSIWYIMWCQYDICELEGFNFKSEKMPDLGVNTFYLSDKDWVPHKSQNKLSPRKVMNKNRLTHTVQSLI